MDYTQAQTAAVDLVCAIRAFIPKTHDPAAPASLEMLASTYESIVGSLSLDGDYDVLVARKLRAVADIFRSDPLPALEYIKAALDELLLEIDEALP